MTDTAQSTASTMRMGDAGNIQQATLDEFCGLIPFGNLLC